MVRLLQHARLVTLAAAMVAATAGFAAAQPFAPLSARLSNNVPLAFGMDPVDVAQALGTPISYVSGRRGDEIYLAIRSIGGSGFFNRRDRLFLQFRHGRLTGWKGDWGRNWMWH